MSEPAGFVQRGRIASAEAMVALLGACFAGDAVQIVQRPDGSDFSERFRRFAPDQAGDLVRRWEEGRVFSGRMEVRWRALEDGTFEVTALAEEDVALGRFGLQPAGPAWEAAPRPAERSGILLWGSYRAVFGKWVEVRLPRQLSYPVAGRPEEGDRARVGHVEYLAPNGAVQYVRLREVI